MRALLIVNPQATATTARTRDVLARALASDLKLDIVETERRGHAADLARQAVADDLDVVVALGGDGTVNEAVNGLAGSSLSFAVVPGGSTNVFARALGLSASPVEATSEILDALRAGRRRVINLGQADDRYFTFCAGLGIDAEVVHEVERRRRAGRRATPGLFVRSAVRHFYTDCDRRQAALTLHEPDAEPVHGLFNLVVANGRPWTYLGGRAVDPCPAGDFDAGLDALGLTRLSTFSMLRTVRQMLVVRARVKGRRLVARHDLEDFTVSSSRPIALQLDGDYIGERERVVFRSVPRALSVVV
ncbi:MAG TPA: diacylglycerol kinase family protein [Mycobacteriales bacterium]|nr:diacylglycerol kinase family protein [Mycobacteriales bacterium]